MENPTEGYLQAAKGILPSSVRRNFGQMNDTRNLGTLYDRIMLFDRSH